MAGDICAVSLAPSGNNAVLASRTGIYIVAVDDLYTVQRFLPYSATTVVADVQWSPHASRTTRIASTTSQHVLLWDFDSPTSKTALSTLQGHDRAITSIDFSSHHADVLATCALDGFLFLWDARTPKKPTLRLSDWFESASQVKFNKQDGHILASSHGGHLHVWDTRKGAEPVRTISAHTRKIYSIDWHKKRRDHIVTSSFDQSIKLWSSAQGDSMEKETGRPLHAREVRTGYPVYSAQFTPFDDLVLALPHRGDLGLHAYDLQPSGVEGKNGESEAHHTFKGCSGPIKRAFWLAGSHLQDTESLDSAQLFLLGMSGTVSLCQLEMNVVSGLRDLRRSQSTNPGQEHQGSGIKYQEVASQIWQSDSWLVEAKMAIHAHQTDLVTLRARDQCEVGSGCALHPHAPVRSQSQSLAALHPLSSHSETRSRGHRETQRLFCCCSAPELRLRLESAQGLPANASAECRYRSLDALYRQVHCPGPGRLGVDRSRPPNCRLRGFHRPSPQPKLEGQDSTAVLSPRLGRAVLALGRFQTETRESERQGGELGPAVAKGPMLHVLKGHLLSYHPFLDINTWYSSVSSSCLFGSIGDVDTKTLKFGRLYLTLMVVDVDLKGRSLTLGCEVLGLAAEATQLRLRFSFPPHYPLSGPAKLQLHSTVHDSEPLLRDLDSQLQATVASAGKAGKPCISTVLQQLFYFLRQHSNHKDQTVNHRALKIDDTKSYSSHRTQDTRQLVLQSRDGQSDPQQSLKDSPRPGLYSAPSSSHKIQDTRQFVLRSRDRQSNPQQDVINSTQSRISTEPNSQHSKRPFQGLAISDQLVTAASLDDEEDEEEEDTVVGNPSTATTTTKDLVHHTVRNAHLPSPRTCSAAWSASGSLACFFATNRTVLQPSQRPKPLDYRGVAHFLDYRSLPCSNHNTSSSSSSSSSSSDPFEAQDRDSPAAMEHSASMAQSGVGKSFWYRGTKHAPWHYGAPTDEATESSTAEAWEPNTQPASNVRVINLEEVLPAQRNLAEEYMLQGEPAAICLHNSEVCKGHGDLLKATTWRVISLLVESVVPLARTTESAWPSLVPATRNVVQIARSKSLVHAPDYHHLKYSSRRLIVRQGTHKAVKRGWISPSMSRKR